MFSSAQSNQLLQIFQIFQRKQVILSRNLIFNMGQEPQWQQIQCLCSKYSACAANATPVQQIHCLCSKYSACAANYGVQTTNYGIQTAH